MRLIISILVLLASSHAFATDLTIPHSFSPDTPALADEVNANFSATETAVNSKQDQLSGTNCAAGEAVQSIIADGTGMCIELNPARIGYLSLPGEAFVSASGGPVSTSSDDGGAYVTASTTDTLVAPVQLPQGAVITEFKVLMVNSAPSGIEASLNRRNHGSNGITTIATLTPPHTYISGISEYTSSPLLETVDNASQSYLVRARAVIPSTSTVTGWPNSSALRIQSVRIAYTY
jgi:hypothetical protein